jgi:hypothetical protein
MGHDWIELVQPPTAAHELADHDGRLPRFVPHPQELHDVRVHRAVVAQVDPFEKANFETSFFHFIGSTSINQGLKPGELYISFFHFSPSLASFVISRRHTLGSTAFSTCTAPHQAAPDGHLAVELLQRDLIGHAVRRVAVQVECESKGLENQENTFLAFLASLVYLTQARTS